MATKIQRIKLSMRALLLTFLASCASSQHWVKSGVTSAASNQTLATCALESEGKVAFSTDPATTEPRQRQVDRLTNLCMQAQGYVRDTGASGD
jgi:hypothetical protein